MGREQKNSEKTVDLHPAPVYIQECHPLEQTVLIVLARLSVFSRIIF
jgi:hypothetical protein